MGILNKHHSHLKENTDHLICNICPNNCHLSNNQIGLCKARSAVDGLITCNNYGVLTSLSLDPIEKKPLAQFHPGSMILSAGSYGCNLRCPFCQNHEISQVNLETSSRTTPEQLVSQALSLKEKGNIGIAFTYNEPLVGYEFVRDTSRLAKEKGLKTVMVTNGYMAEEILDELLGCIDAFNIDLKCFTEKGYQALGGRLDVVKRSIVAAAAVCHVEVTTLVVPGLSDNLQDMEEEARWIAEVSTGLPLHISRYFPRWMASGLPTDPQVVRELVTIARKHLHHVYLGNL